MDEKQLVRAIWKSKTGTPHGGMDAQKLTPPIEIVSTKRITRRHPQGDPNRR